MEARSESLPKLDLTTFILSVSSAAMMGLGLDLETHDFDPSKVDLRLAQQNIELLELILEKTQGNRTKDEDQLIEQILFELRMRFVEAQKKQSGKES